MSRPPNNRPNSGQPNNQGVPPPYSVSGGYPMNPQGPPSQILDPYPRQYGGAGPMGGPGPDAQFYPSHPQFPMQPIVIDIHSALGPLDALNLAFGQDEQFLFVQTDSPGFRANPVIVEVRNGRGQPILSGMHTPAQEVGRTSNTIVYMLSDTHFTDASGKRVLRAVEERKGITVTAGDTIVGIVDGWSMFGTIRAKNGMGQRILRVDKKTLDNENGRGTEYSLIQEGTGVELGKLVKSDNRISLWLSRQMDIRTRAIFLVTAYFLFLKYHAITAFGSGGASGLQKKRCIFSLVTSLIIIGVVLVIVFVVI